MYVSECKCSVDISCHFSLHEIDKVCETGQDNFNEEEDEEKNKDKKKRKEKRNIEK